jgi:hypothetical protein
LKTESFVFTVHSLGKESYFAMHFDWWIRYLNECQLLVTILKNEPRKWYTINETKHKV